MDLLLIGNDQTLTLTGVRDEISGAYLNAATVTARLKDLNGDDVAGASWPLTLAYVAASDGIYRGNLDDAIQLKANEKYYIEISVASAGGIVGFWRFARAAQYRTP